MSKIYRVRCEHRSVEIVRIRAESRDDAMQEAGKYIVGINLTPYETTILEEIEDDGSGTDN